MFELLLPVPRKRLGYEATRALLFKATADCLHVIAAFKANMDNPIIALRLNVVDIMRRMQAMPCQSEASAPSWPCPVDPRAMSEHV